MDTRKESHWQREDRMKRALTDALARASKSAKQRNTTVYVQWTPAGRLILGNRLDERTVGVAYFNGTAIPMGNIASGPAYARAMYAMD